MLTIKVSPCQFKEQNVIFCWPSNQFQPGMGNIENLAATNGFEWMENWWEWFLHPFIPLNFYVLKGEIIIYFYPYLKMFRENNFFIFDAPLFWTKNDVSPWTNEKFF